MKLATNLEVLLLCGFVIPLTSCGIKYVSYHDKVGGAKTPFGVVESAVLSSSGKMFAAATRETEPGLRVGVSVTVGSTTASSGPSTKESRILAAYPALADAKRGGAYFWPAEVWVKAAGDASDPGKVVGYHDKAAVYYIDVDEETSMVATGGFLSYTYKKVIEGQVTITRQCYKTESQQSAKEGKLQLDSQGKPSVEDCTTVNPDKIDDRQVRAIEAQMMKSWYSNTNLPVVNYRDKEGAVQLQIEVEPAWQLEATSLGPRPTVHYFYRGLGEKGTDVIVWSSGSQREFARYSHPGTVRALKFVGGNRLFTYCDDDQTVRLYSLEKKDPVRTQRLEQKKDRKLDHVTFSGDGRFVAYLDYKVGAFTGSEFTLIVQGIEDPTYSFTDPSLGKASDINIFFSKDGKYMAVAAANLLRIYSLTDKKLFKDLSAGATKKEVPFAGVFSDDGRSLFTADNKDQISMWDIETGSVPAVQLGQKIISNLVVDKENTVSYMSGVSNKLEKVSFKK